MATAAEVFRDYVTDGVPSSGAKKPKKSEIRTLLGGYEIRLNTADLGGAIWKATKALLTADLAHAADSLAVVYDDPASANNGLYVKVGASGTGSWSQITTFLPGYQFVTATDDGNSTTNAYTMDTNPRLPYGDGVALVELVVPATNTSATVTVSFDGETPLTLKTASGNAPAIGGLVEGMPVSGVKIGSSFFMRSDQASAALLAQAEAAAAEAEGYKDQAAGYADIARKNWTVAGRFTATGVEQDVALLVDPGSELNMFVAVGSSWQPAGGDTPPWLLIYPGGVPTIRITADVGAPVVVMTGTASEVDVPPDGSVTEPKLGTQSVSTRALEDGVLSADTGGRAKMADKFVTLDKIADISAPARLIGRKTTGAGSPEELTALDIIELFYPSGSVVQSKYTSFGGRGPFTAAIPIDDTVPLISEGTEILALSFTPLFATSKLRIRFQGDANAETGSGIIWAAFVDNACAAAGYTIADMTGYTRKIGGEVDWPIASTTAKTVSIRVGPESNTKNLYFSGPSTTRLFGGATAATLVVEEIKG